MNICCQNKLPEVPNRKIESPATLPEKYNFLDFFMLLDQYGDCESVESCQLEWRCLEGNRENDSLATSPFRTPLPAFHH